MHDSDSSNASRLRECEELLALILANTSDGVVTIAPEPNDGFRLTSTNRRFLAMTGLSEGQVVGVDLRDFILKPRQPLVFGKFAEAIATGRPVQFSTAADIPAGMKDGTATVYPVFEKPEICTQLVVMIRDNTLAKQAEQTVRDHEDRFKHLFEYSTVAKSVTSSTDEMVVNRAFCEMLGYTTRELEGIRWPELTHPDDHALCKREIDALKSGQKESARYEKRYLTKTGAVVWADVASTVRRDSTGKLLYIVTSMVDITQRKRAEQEAERTNAFLDSIVENIPNALFIKDAKELRFVRINRAVEELLGRSRAEMVGRNDYDFFPKELANFFVQKDREALQLKRVVDIPEEPVRTQDEAEHVLHTKKVPILGPDGEPEYLLGIGEDITERKRVERANSEKLEELRRWHEVTLGRETRILELKREVNELLARLGEPPRYASADDQGH